MDRIARRVRIRRSVDDPGVISAMTRVLFEEEKFVYDLATGNPDNYLLDRVLAWKRGNCLGMTVVYLALAERLDIPLGSVYVPSHCFVRYEGNGARINVETAMGGAERKDEWYARKYHLKEGSPYLRTLGRRDMIGVYLKTLGAAYSRKGMEEASASSQAALFSPGLPDAYFNAGVYAEDGKERGSDRPVPTCAGAADMEQSGEPLPPPCAVAAGLKTGYASSARRSDNPKNSVARSGLARRISPGLLPEAAEHCDRAMEQGCRFDSRC